MNRNWLVITCITILLLGSIFYLHYKKQKSQPPEGLTNQQIGGLQNIQSERLNMPLAQYCIKSSYNSAYDGSKITTKQLTQVIVKGVRFIDLEIYLINDTPCVGYSTDKSLTNLDSTNSIPLNDIFTAILSNCFSSNNCSNFNDPFFIHLRIKTKEEDRNSIYKKVAATIDTFFGKSKTKLYLDEHEKPIPVNETTILKDILSKVIFIIDKSINPDYANYTNCYNDKQCVDLTNYINMESGGNTMSIEYFDTILNKQTKPPVIMNDFKTTNANSIQFVVPPPIGKNKNPDLNMIKQYITQYGIQNIAFQFWDTTTNLDIYESIFQNYKTAFIPLAYIVRDLNQNNLNL
jgi:hypothetical protein